jgi:hypothetical protein
MQRKGLSCGSISVPSSGGSWFVRLDQDWYCESCWAVSSSRWRRLWGSTGFDSGRLVPGRTHAQHMGGGPGAFMHKSCDRAMQRLHVVSLFLREPVLWLQVWQTGAR